MTLGANGEGVIEVGESRKVTLNLAMMREHGDFVRVNGKSMFEPTWRASLSAEMLRAIADEMDRLNAQNSGNIDDDAGE